MSKLPYLGNDLHQRGGDRSLDLLKVIRVRALQPHRETRLPGVAVEPTAGICIRAMMSQIT